MANSHALIDVRGKLFCKALVLLLNLPGMFVDSAEES